MTAPSLRPLSTTTWAWVHDRIAWGFSNCGLIASDGEALLVDTQFTLAETQDLLDAIADSVPGARITTVVNSHQNGDHTWGNQLVSGAQFITSTASGVNLCQEMTPGQLTALSRSALSTPVAAYAAEHFGSFDFSGITVQGPTRTFSGRLELKVGQMVVELIDLGPGHSHGDVAVHVPEDGVVFAGDALFNGAHMVVWSDSLRACISACDTLLGTGAAVFVPGHGKITDRGGVTAIRDLLARVFDTAAGLAAAGVPLREAARRVSAQHAGQLAHPERLFTAVAAAYKDVGVPGIPAGTLPLVEGMADLAQV
ncbi:MBL fold metallo-hydrolase [Streptomyces sp. CA-294286]|uniref:MBL fold metallo-hydrolase n=1 Tax=Streptomyces sp. CA-294286 TaxID=3240070 RepID=UPI003D916D7E